MIKNCLRTENEFFHYDIKYNDEVIAKAHNLSILEINNHIDSTEDSKIAIKDPFGLIKKAIDSWEFADAEGKILPITVENIRNLKNEYQIVMLTAITENYVKVLAESKDIEKNL